MWLINTRTTKLEEFLSDNAPPYAILSHTWENEEVTFREMQGGATDATRQKKGYAKIEQTCRLAAQDEIGYCWVDTCCIDKSSSAELTESINSMYNWYQRSEVCYAFLSDHFPGVTIEVGFPRCRWFTRGWTLQELIAPRKFIFYDCSWQPRTTKQESAYLITSITRIPSDYLWYPQSVKHASVAEKMSWASGRETTRVEDIAYCMLGIFDINMPMLYGEGTKAFLRLQEEVVRRTNDLSLFAWRPVDDEDAGYRGVLAESPTCFQTCTILANGSKDNEFSVTNKGIRITAQIFSRVGESNLPPHFLLYLGYDRRFRSVYLVLQKWGLDEFIRDNSIAGGTITEPQIEPSLTTQRLGMQSILLTSTPGFEVSEETISHIRRKAVRFELSAELRVFEVMPQSVWDPSHSLFLDPAVSVMLHVGFRREPYGTIQILSLRGREGGRTTGTVYILSNSSPAIPFLTQNLATVTETELSHFWNLSPVRLEVQAGMDPNLCSELYGQHYVNNDLVIYMSAGFNRIMIAGLESVPHGAATGDGGQGYLQLNRLSISARRLVATPVPSASSNSGIPGSNWTWRSR